MKTELVQVRFLLGPAGSGKTFRCLTEVRQALSSAPEGSSLILLAPKQTTYQLERQLLADPSLPGYTRLQILSFERLAHFIFERLRTPSPDMLDEEGRVMVLRGLLARKRDQLKLFRASARLTGFAQELSLVLGELQRNQQTPDTLLQLAETVRPADGLAGKLRDFAMLLQDYLDWLKNHNLQDADCLLESAAKALVDTPRPNPQKPTLAIGPVWVDGFAEWSAQELDLMAALIPHCERATLTFCLDRIPMEKVSWLSVWSVVRRAYEQVKKRLERVPGIELSIDVLPRDPARNRFLDNPVLQHLEKFWVVPQTYTTRSEMPDQAPDPKSSPNGGKPNPSIQLEWLWAGEPKTALLAKQKVESTKAKPVEHVPVGTVAMVTQSVRREASMPVPAPLIPGTAATPAVPGLERALRVATCVDPDAEATLAAREILRHVRAGGRFREVTVLVRDLASYHQHLQRIFSRYDIPFFMDQRESVSHHPLAELTRSALRTLVFQWKNEEWFAALKTGLIRAEEEEIDCLENEALARGWTGAVWHQPIRINQPTKSAAEQAELRRLEIRLEQLRQRIVPPFENLELAIQSHQNKPSGRQLATALRDFWNELQVERTLQDWNDQGILDRQFRTHDSVHATVWGQINVWLQNLELAFPNETLALRDWLPIVDAGLSTLSVGIIPPALDQVLIGAIDRSRNPEVKLALILGMNETVFPSPAQASVLLTEGDREVLEKQNVSLGASAKQRLGRERYLAYISCSRARHRVVLTHALNDAQGSPLHPSPFLSQIKQLFPTLVFENIPRGFDWRESEHVTELIEPLLRNSALENRAGVAETGSRKSQDQLPGINDLEKLAEIPSLAAVIDRIRRFQTPQIQESLSPELAEKLYGRLLHTSVSSMEAFAACPFKFFVDSGLRAEERKLFELDTREQGSFQHDVLASFHEQLRRQNKRWRDITPQTARDLIAEIARGMIIRYRDGLLQQTEESRFTARVLTESLQDFAETLVGWMQHQYQFDPAKVELPFGGDQDSPAWHIGLKNGRGLALHGRIDRVDLWRQPNSQEALCVVVDYKSGRKQLDPLLMAHGIQLQLLAYLNVLRHWPEPLALFGVKKLRPAGVFYVTLKGKYRSARHRSEALADPASIRKLAYRHLGRFDVRALPQLDGRPNVIEGDQFNYRLTGAGEAYKNCHDPVQPAEFQGMLDSVEANLKKMGEKIFSGCAEVAPYSKGKMTACHQCNFLSICRIDPWTHTYRVLKKIEEANHSEKQES